MITELGQMFVDSCCCRPDGNYVVHSPDTDKLFEKIFSCSLKVFFVVFALLVY